jgi:hypothetical protein
VPGRVPDLGILQSQVPQMRTTQSCLNSRRNVGSPFNAARLEAVHVGYEKEPERAALMRLEGFRDQGLKIRQGRKFENTTSLMLPATVQHT